MSLKSFFTKVFSKNDVTRKQDARFINSESIFSQFGDNIYASDIVQNCIDIIAAECSKMQPRHIRIKDGIQSVPKSSINTLFTIGPNKLMTTHDFLEKIIWLLYLNYNCFIYPMYETYRDDYGNAKKRYTEFYPLNPSVVEFEEDANGRLYAHMWFRKGEDFTLPYDKIIHLRKKYSVNDIMGGGYNGQPDNDALISVLETNNTMIEGIGKAVKSSLTIRGIVKVNSLLNDENQEKEIAKFEKKMTESITGILPLDLKSEYIPIKAEGKIVDESTMKFIEGKVLNWFGVSKAMLDGDFSDDQYQAFYEKTLEPLMISLGQAFTKTIFSRNEISFGNKITFFPKNMMYLSTKSKLDIIKIAGEQGLLTNDQKLQLLGYPPIGGEEGAKRTQSLNYVDTSLVNDYQMSKANAPQINTGGND